MKKKKIVSKHTHHNHH